MTGPSFAAASRNPAHRSYEPDPANFHCETRAMATFGGRDSAAKDTKPKGFSHLVFAGLNSTNGETMGTAASPFLNPIAAELEGVGPKPTAKALSRRAKQRRQIQGMIAASYVLDALVLLIYAHAGTIPIDRFRRLISAACGLP